MESRRASIELIYEGKNITADIAPDLKEFKFNDNASGMADDVTVELKDNKGKWLSIWAPQKGDIIKPTIITQNWRREGDEQRLFCGTFLVDEPKYSGPPRVLSLGAVSVPANTGFMTTEKSRTWDSASIKKIAQTIAASAGLQLFFDSKSNPVVDFLEQSDTSDVSFLFDLCLQNGLAMKLYNNRIIIFNEAEYEAKPAVATHTMSEMIHWDAKTTFTDTGYDGCKVEYMDPDTGESLSYTFRAPGKKGKKIYKVNETAQSLAEAQRLTKAKLRELNKKEYTFSFTTDGCPEQVSSQTVNINGFGFFDGKYYIDRIERKVGGGTTATLDLHRVLEGY
jgi:phage protein D